MTSDQAKRLAVNDWSTHQVSISFICSVFCTCAHSNLIGTFQLDIVKLTKLTNLLAGWLPNIWCALSNGESPLPKS